MVLTMVTNRLGYVKMVFERSWYSQIWRRWSNSIEYCRKLWKWNKRFKQKNKSFKNIIKKMWKKSDRMIHNIKGKHKNYKNEII